MQINMKIVQVIYAEIFNRFSRATKVMQQQVTLNKLSVFVFFSFSFFVFCHYNASKELTLIRLDRIHS